MEDDFGSKGDNYGLMIIEQFFTVQKDASPRQRTIHLNVPFIARKRIEDDFLLNRFGYAIVLLLDSLEWLVLGDDPR